MMDLRIFIAIAAARLCTARAWPATTVSIGNGLAGVSICATPTVILSHTLSANATYGLLTHFWTTGDMDVGVVIEYFVDSESQASIAFTPSMASGQGFPQYMTSDSIDTGGLYSAGGKMGKAAAEGGWYNTFKIPFYSSVAVQARVTDGGACRAAWLIARGHEVYPMSSAAPDTITISATLSVPVGARLVMQSLENQVFPALWFVSLANVSLGYAGAMLLSTMAISTSPPANNYIEGCWHLFTDGNVEFPGLVVGTGVEDMYNSAFWFGAASGFPDGILFAQANSGLLHFSRGAPLGADNVEQFSAYRFFDEEVFGFSNGGRLVWRVGDQIGKCTLNGTANPIGTPSAVTISSYSWLYVWENGQPVEPLPPLPTPSYMTYACQATRCVPVADSSGQFWASDCGGQCTAAPSPMPTTGPPAVVGCSDGTCEAFCSSAGVHGCAASWNGNISMRTPATGKPCGGGLGLCSSPSDACAAGWTLCMSNFSVSSVVDFRAGITDAECATGDSCRYVAAMQHANPAWASIPPNPCPPAPQDTDNGCAADGWGAEPICCGANCTIPSCPNDVWMGGTHIHIGTNEGCGGLSSQFVDGILCCKI